MCLSATVRRVLYNVCALFNEFTFAKQKRAFLLPAGALRTETHEDEKWKTINVNKALL